MFLRRNGSSGVGEIGAKPEDGAGRPIRACIVNEFFWPDERGGTGTVLSELARTLRVRHPDLSLDVVTSRNLYRKTGDEPNTLAARETWNGVRIFRARVPNSAGLQTLPRLMVNALFGLAA